ncbi:MAG: peptidylprolyl isomerase [Faecalibacterium sp.]|nr:peptidylprolyl isomerase [Ruminococcus sp.]MCM1393080.1 peptidylprolyl isomerase [Ruminococcus sp.]MCM1485162.1 peptidylprolyl isomerase [Faecalibacterium sp.]
MKLKRIIAVAVAMIIALTLLCSCSKSDSKEDNTMNHPQVNVKMENGGEFTIELYPEYAPATVENFLKLVNEGFYNGLTFHRVVENFMAQGGDPDGTGMGGSKDKIKGEFSSNGFTQNTLSHTRGVISMARSAQNDSASSQFFICYTDSCVALDGSYAAFGKVIKGMEVVDDFCKNEMTYNSMGEKASPVEPIYIDSMTEVK